MDSVKFLQERNRMYESGAATPGIGLEDDYDPVSAVKVVEKWAAAHPAQDAAGFVSGAVAGGEYW